MRPATKSSKSQITESSKTLLLTQGHLAQFPYARVFGYARVSTEEQDLGMQIAALDKMGCTKIFQEKESAVDLRRPQWRLLRKFLERGDFLIVYAFSRISRNLKELLQIVDELEAEGVTIISTSEPHIKPYTTAGRMMLQVVGAMDENERRRLSDRTKDGMAARKAAGQRMGRPILMTPEKIKQAKNLRRGKMPAKQIAKRLGVSISAIYGNT